MAIPENIRIRMALSSGLLLLLLLIAPFPAWAQFDEFGRTDAQKEIEVGRQAAREYEKMYSPSQDKAMQARIERIGSELVAALPQKMYPYQFKVLGSSEINACCFPGGFIYVNEGLAARLPDDNALAFVMGHEITHGAHRHHMRQLQKMKGISLLTIAGSVLTGNNEAMSLIKALINLKYSREDENDADKTGMETMWRAGFDIKGVVETMNLLAKAEGNNRIPAYLRDHPAPIDRLKRLESMIDTVKSQPRAVIAAPSTAPVQSDSDLTPLIGVLPEQEIAPNPWFPLAVGNSWTYSVSGNAGQSGYTLRVGSALAVKTAAVFRAETLFGKGTAIACQFFTTSTEVYRRNRPALPQSAWNVEYVVPLADDKPLDKVGNVYTSLPSEPINLPCGSFKDLLHIRKQAGQNNYDLWFARHIGLVKRVCVETGVTETLTAYKVQSAGEPNNVQTGAKTP